MEVSLFIETAEHDTGFFVCVLLDFDSVCKCLEAVLRITLISLLVLLTKYVEYLVYVCNAWPWCNTISV